MKLRGIFYKLRLDNQAVIFVFAFAALTFFVLYPFLSLLLKSVGMDISGSGAFSFAAFGAVMRDRNIFRAGVNSLVIGGMTAALALSRALFNSWLVTRTDFRYKKFVQRNAFLTFTVPSYILGIAYLELMSRNGYVGRFAGFLGMNVRPSPYSLFAVALVMSVHLYPMCFYTLVHASRGIDPSFEDAAVMAGAGRMQAFFTVTLPLMLPAVFSIGLFVFSRSMSNFGVPALLLMPSYRETLSTQLYRSLARLDLQMLAAQAVFLLVLSFSVFLLQGRVLRGKRFSSRNGKGDVQIMHLGCWERFVNFAVFSVEILTCVLPVSVVFLTSFLKRWGVSLTLENFTLVNYARLFSDGCTLRAFGNSFMYGLSAALIAALLAAAVAYISGLENCRWGFIPEAVASWPMAMPNIVMAIAAILAWNGGFFNFYGTPVILVVSYVALFLPLCLKHISGTMKNIDMELFHAARISGASPLAAYRDVILPAVSPALKASVLLAMLIAFREIPLSLMLHSSGTETVGVLLFNMRSNSGGLEVTSTVASVVIAALLVVRIVAGRVLKND